MKINTEIRASTVRVIAEDGEQLGILSLSDALQQAQKMGKDLVEIAPNANPPVCKIINYGKLRYRQAKKEKESKKAQHQIKVKEIKLRPNIDVHDLNTKINRGREFILKGNKVKVICMFRGREMLHIDLGHKLFQQIIDALQDVSVIEVPPKLFGGNLSLVLAPLGKAK